MRAVALLASICLLVITTQADAAGKKKPAKPYYGYQSHHLRGGYGAKHAAGQYGSHPKREKPKRPG